MHSYKEYVYTILDGVVSVSRLKSGESEASSATQNEGSASTAAANRQIEAEVASQDKQRRKSIKYNHYDADVHAELLSLL